MFVFYLSLLANGKWRAFLSQISRVVQHVPRVPSLRGWAAGVNHSNSWHTPCQSPSLPSPLWLTLSIAQNNKKVLNPAESEIPTVLNRTRSHQDNIKDNPWWHEELDSVVKACALKAVWDADTLIQGTDRILSGTNSWRPSEIHPRAPEMALYASFRKLIWALNNLFMSCTLQLHHSPIKMC